MKKVNIKIKNLQQIECKKGEKALGVTMGPALKWDRQFVAMVNKIKEAIVRLKNNNKMISTASMRCNMYLSKKGYFGSGFCSLNVRQENILKKKTRTSNA